MTNTDTDNRINYFVEQSRLRGLDAPVLMDNGIAQSLIWKSGRITVKAYIVEHLFITVGATECSYTIYEFLKETDSEILDSIVNHLSL